MAAERLDKILAGLGVGSRREITAMARGGKIAVNGVICRDAACKIEPKRDKLMVDGAPVFYRVNWYFMLNKPAGVITATEDRVQTTVLSLFSEQLQRCGLFPVGRLDKDTEGLLLLTTDGAFDHALMAPKRHVSKIYEARIEGVLAADAQKRFAEGMVLEDGTQCRPAELVLLAPDRVRVTLHEGKFHQVKRMLHAVGGAVTALRRTAIGALTLDPALRAGQYRELTADEIQLLLHRNPTKYP